MKKIFNYRSFVFVILFSLVIVFSGCGQKDPSLEITPNDNNAEFNYPTKEIMQLIPLAPGGGFDTLGRKFAEKLSEVLGVPVITENVHGAGATLALIELKRVKPDGYTIAHFHGENNPISQVIFDAPYDIREYTYLGGIRRSQYIIAVEKDSTIQSIEDFLNAGVLTAGVPGTGHPGEIAALTFSESFNTRITVIPYDGNGPALAGLLAGDIDFIISSDGAISNSIELVKPIFVLAEERNKYFPEVPTIIELGYSDIFRPVTIQGLVGPPGMDDAVAEFLRNAIKETVTSQDMQNWADDANLDVLYIEADELRERSIEMLKLAEEYRHVFEAQ